MDNRRNIEDCQMPSAAELASLIFPIVLVAAMVTDLRRFEIPNVLPIVLACAYPVAAALAGHDLNQMLWHGAVGGCALLVGMIMFFLRVFGGGDAKLIAAVALWTGPSLVVDFTLFTAVFGGAIALVLLLFWRLPLPSALAGVPALRRLHTARNQVPYALAIGASGLLVYTNLPLFGP